MPRLVLLDLERELRRLQQNICVKTKKNYVVTNQWEQCLLIFPLLSKIHESTLPNRRLGRGTCFRLAVSLS